MVKIKNITKTESRAIAEYEDALIKRYPGRLAKIILFGSKARGDDHPGSDIDLLIVLTKNGKDTAKDIICLTHEPIARYSVDISPIVVEESFFKRWSPLLGHIRKEGVTLWTNKDRRNT